MYLLSFALAMVNLAASRMVLNLKYYAASRRPVIHDGTDLTYPSILLVSLSPPSAPVREMSSSNRSAFDAEMYSIEREYQQLGTKLR